MANKLKSVRQQSGQWPEIGQLRKGGKAKTSAGKEYPIDLKYFRFTSEVPGMEERFREVYGDEPSDLEGCLIPYELERAMDSSQQEWDATGLVHECDGEYVTLKRGPGGRVIDVEPGTEKCPGGCKPRGCLRIMLPKLGVIGTVRLLTGSAYEMREWKRSLGVLEDNLDHGAKGVLVDLRRRDTKIAYVDPKDGKRKTTTKAVVYLSYNQEWSSSQLPKLLPLIAPALTELSAGSEIIPQQIEANLDDVLDSEIDTEVEEAVIDGEVEEAPVKGDDPEWVTEGIKVYGVGWAPVYDGIMEKGGITPSLKGRMTKAWNEATSSLDKFAVHLLTKVVRLDDSEFGAGQMALLIKTLEDMGGFNHYAVVRAFGELFETAMDDDLDVGEALEYAISHTPLTTTAYSS